MFIVEIVFVSIWAAITKSQRLGSLNNGNLFLKILKFGKPQIKAGRDSVSGVDPLPALSSHVRKKERNLSYLL